MLQNILIAIDRTFSAPLRPYLFKVIGFAFAIVFVVWIALADWFGGVQITSTSWLDAILHSLGALSFLIALGLAFPVMTSLLAGFFLDDIAQVVERQDFKLDVDGQAMPLARSIWISVKFAALVLVVNLLMLPLYFFPGVNAVVFYIVNGYLLGREYFSFVAMRFLSESETTHFRKQNRFDVFVYGLVIAGVVSIPVVNLITPIFATVLMVHLFKKLAKFKQPFAA